MRIDDNNNDDDRNGDDGATVAGNDNSDYDRDYMTMLIIQNML